MYRSPVAVTVPTPATARLICAAACRVAPPARVTPAPPCGMPTGAARVPWLTASVPVEVSVSPPLSVRLPDPLLTNPPEPLIEESNSKAPPLMAKAVLPASVIGVLIDCVPLLTVTVAVPLLLLSVRLPLLSV